MLSRQSNINDNVNPMLSLLLPGEAEAGILGSTIQQSKVPGSIIISFSRESASWSPQTSRCAGHLAQGLIKIVRKLGNYLGNNWDTIKEPRYKPGNFWPTHAPSCSPYTRLTVRGGKMIKNRKGKKWKMYVSKTISVVNTYNIAYVFVTLLIPFWFRECHVTFQPPRWI